MSGRLAVINFHKDILEPGDPIQVDMVEPRHNCLVVGAMHLARGILFSPITLRKDDRPEIGGIYKLMRTGPAWDLEPVAPETLTDDQRRNLMAPTAEGTEA